MTQWIQSCVTNVVLDVKCVDRLLATNRQQMMHEVRRNMTCSVKIICHFVLCHTWVRHNHSYLTVWVPQGRGGGIMKAMQRRCVAVNIIGHQNKASESQFAGAESNLFHLSNSTGNKQELSQTSIKLWFVCTQVSDKASCYYLWLAAAEIQQTVAEHDWGSEAVFIWSCIIIQAHICFNQKEVHKYEILRHN